MQRSLKDISLFLADEHLCSYLVAQQASSLFIDPSLELSQGQYSELTKLGFRRSGLYTYRPHCKNCQACVPTRVKVAQFKANRQQMRVMKRNMDLQVNKLTPRYLEEHYQLYERYITMRHSDGDMYPPNQKQYTDFLVNAPDYCFFYEFRFKQQLLAVAVTDHLKDGLSAVYTFFEPTQKQRSLGQFAILWQIQHSLNLGLSKLYLGYWIKNCKKMNYKLQYRPIELFLNQKWTTLT